MKADIHVGILALQGNFEQHKAILHSAGTKIPQNVHTHFITNTLSLMQKYDAVILPGGESSAMRTLLHKMRILEPMQYLIHSGIPILATCAGTILLAQRIHKEYYDIESTQREALDPMAVVFSAARITVNRNGYGRQIFSFSAKVETSMDFEVEGLFIRAPIITAVGEEVEILATYEGHPVIVRQDSMLMATFHPEAAEDDSLHTFFLQKMVPV